MFRLFCMRLLRATCWLLQSRETFRISSEQPNKEERKWAATSVEIFECKSCARQTRFTRFNHLGKLLETRRGRHSECVKVELFGDWVSESLVVYFVSTNFGIWSSICCRLDWKSLEWVLVWRTNPLDSCWRCWESVWRSISLRVALGKEVHLHSCFLE